MKNEGVQAHFFPIRRYQCDGSQTWKHCDSSLLIDVIIASLELGGSIRYDP